MDVMNVKRRIELVAFSVIGVAVLLGCRKEPKDWSAPSQQSNRIFDQQVAQGI